jgi:hypothetical protein
MQKNNIYSETVLAKTDTRMYLMMAVYGSGHVVKKYT